MLAFSNTNLRVIIQQKQLKKSLSWTLFMVVLVSLICFNQPYSFTPKHALPMQRIIPQPKSSSIFLHTHSFHSMLPMTKSSQDVTCCTVGSLAVYCPSSQTCCYKGGSCSVSNYACCTLGYKCSGSQCVYNFGNGTTGSYNNNGGLSTCAIMGISIGSFVGFVIFCVLVGFLIRGKKGTNPQVATSKAVDTSWSKCWTRLTTSRGSARTTSTTNSFLFTTK